MADLESRFVRVGGRDVHVRVGGEGPPIVLVHGIGVSSRYFFPLGEELAADRAVFAPDLPGSGRSDSPPRALGIGGLSGALLTTLDALELGRVAIVANSLGCQVVADLALRKPERVAALVLIGPTVNPHARSGGRQVAALVEDCVYEPPPLLAIIALDYARFGPRRFVATARAALADRIEEKLPRIEAPALVIRGEHDTLAPQGWCEEAAALLPNGRPLAVVPGAAHAAHYSAPGPAASLVRSFLEEVEQDAGELGGRVEHRHVAGAGEADEPDVA